MTMATGWSPTGMASKVEAPSMSTGTTTSPSVLTVYASAPSAEITTLLALELVPTLAITSSMGEVFGTSTLNMALFDVCAPTVTERLPLKAPAGTTTRTKSVPLAMAVVDAPGKFTVLLAGTGLKPTPEIVTATPVNALGG